MGPVAKGLGRGTSAAAQGDGATWLRHDRGAVGIDKGDLVRLFEGDHVGPVAFEPDCYRHETGGMG